MNYFRNGAPPRQSVGERSPAKTSSTARRAALLPRTRAASSPGSPGPPVEPNGSSLPATGPGLREQEAARSPPPAFGLIAGAISESIGSMSLDAATDGAGNTGRFLTTRWSLILSSIDGEGEEGKAREALAQLCRIYWRPIFTFICRRGTKVEDAQDLTQDFFLMILKGDLTPAGERGSGAIPFAPAQIAPKFSHRQPRQGARVEAGGDVQFVSWDDWMAEAPSQFAIPASAVESWPAERIFDVRWAATLAEQALRRLQEECESRGRRRVFDVLSTALTADREDVSYEKLATRAGGWGDRDQTALAPAPAALSAAAAGGGGRDGREAGGS